MKYQVTRHRDPTEALGAYSGYRLRLVASRNDVDERYTVRVFFRGSESMPELPIPLEANEAATLDEALERGYARAVEWIDALDANPP